MLNDQPALIPSRAVDKPPTAHAVKERWDRIAEEYDEMVGDEGNPHSKFMIIPAMQALIDDVKGKRALDVGCGTGVFSKLLANTGASVIGADFSEQLLRIARQKHPDIEFVLADAADLPFGAECFDLIAMNMVLHDVLDYEGAISEAARVLKPNGVLVFSITHPCFEPPGSSWQTMSDGRLVFTNDQYFAIVTREFYLKKDGAPIYPPLLQYHRPLQAYVAALKSANFLVTDMLEPQPPLELQSGSPPASWHRESRIAFFLIVRALKGFNGL